MAEFKLGRIRFVWKNDWATTTVYYKDTLWPTAAKCIFVQLGTHQLMTFL